jgi:hypothetical protein
MAEGIREAFYYYAVILAKNIPITKNLHPLYALQRGLFIGLIIFMCPDPSIMNTVVMLLVLSFVFPFFHDGMYYYTRNRLDARTYPKKWWDHSLTSNAIIEINTNGRVLMVLIGIGLFIYFLIEK